MPLAGAAGVNLYFEETGNGQPIVFAHEFAGDIRSWEPQVRYFARRFRCLTFNARGYPPSDVPDDVESYNQDLARDDIAAVMDAAGIEQAYLVGNSMGAYAVLHFALNYPERVSAAVLAAIGYGSSPETTDGFRQDSLALAEHIDRVGAEAFAEKYATGAYRLQFLDKDPRGWLEFKSFLAEHSARGMALTMRGLQSRRPSLYDLKDSLGSLDVPILVIAGDEDEWCLEPNLFLKKQLPTAGLLVLPKTGHTINLEEPALFNAQVEQFFDLVEAGSWQRRAGATQSASALLAWREESR